MTRPYVLLANARQNVADEKRSFARVLGDNRMRSWNLLDGPVPGGLLEAAAAVLIGGSPDPPTPDSRCYAPAIELINLATAVGKPLIGICWGHQMMAIAAGGTVSLGSPELGCYEISLTDTGRRDPLFARAAGQSRTFLASEAHEYMVDELPQGATRLAYSATTPNQAIRYSKNAVSFQWHPEMTRADCIARFKAGRGHAGYLRRLLAGRVENAGTLTWREMQRVAENGLFCDTPIAEQVLTNVFNTAVEAPEDVSAQAG